MVVLRVFGGVFQLFGDVLRNNVVQQQIGLVLHVLHADFVLVGDFVAVEAQSIADLELAVEQKDEDEYEHQIEADFELIVLEPVHIAVAGILYRQIPYQLLVELLVDRYRNLAVIVADHHEKRAGDQGQNVLCPTVELDEVAEVDQAHEQQQPVVELNRRELGDVDEGEVDEYRGDRQRDENAAEKVPRIVLRSPAENGVEVTRAARPAADLLAAQKQHRKDQRTERDEAHHPHLVFSRVDRRRKQEQ